MNTVIQGIQVIQCLWRQLDLSLVDVDGARGHDHGKLGAELLVVELRSTRAGERERENGGVKGGEREGGSKTR